MTAGEREFLLASGAPSESFDPEVQAAARASLEQRAKRTREEASPFLDTSAVASILNRPKPTIRRWAHSGDLYAVRVGHRLGYPGWQFPRSQRLHGLRDVLAVLPGSMHPLSVEGWMTTPNEELDDLTPLAWMDEHHDLAPVLALANSHART